MKRKGFTLTEILIVIALIAILLTILVPTAYKAIVKARIAGTAMEVSALENAVQTFNAIQGVQIPSRLTLCENPPDWKNYPADIATIRSLWPQFNFDMVRDINGNGSFTDILNLDGAECLVFFLGGIVRNGQTPSGFSSDPTNPFSVNSPRGSTFEFDYSRLCDIDGDGMKEFRSKLSPTSGDPYVYYSSNGMAYNPADLIYGMTDFYRTPAGKSGSMGYWKPMTYQIICGGFDGVIGTGGLYDASTPLPVTRANERDNLTNFSQGTLAD